jgi:hypothetical protein
MTDILLQRLAEYGILGLVVFGLCWYIIYLHKLYQEKEALYQKERSAREEREEKTFQTIIDVIQGNTQTLAELKSRIEYDNRKTQDS